MGIPTGIFWRPNFIVMAADRPTGIIRRLTFFTNFLLSTYYMYNKSTKYMDHLDASDHLCAFYQSLFELEGDVHSTSCWEWDCVDPCVGSKWETHHQDQESKWIESSTDPATSHLLLHTIHSVICEHQLIFICQPLAQTNLCWSLLMYHIVVLITQMVKNSNYYWHLSCSFSGHCL